MFSLTSTKKKREKRCVALCQELDVVSQGYTIEEAIKNLKEAVELHIEEMGLPEELTSSKETIVVNFEVNNIGKTTKIVR